jgi:hypothetical protein
VMIKTFLYSWLQVTLIATNTYQVANQKWVGAIIIGFLISFVWTINVGRVVFACNWIRLVYSLGAMTGTGTGILITHLIYKH